MCRNRSTEERGHWSQPPDWEQKSIPSMISPDLETLPSRRIGEPRRASPAVRMRPLRINFPMHLLAEPAPNFLSEDGDRDRKWSQIDRKAPFVLLQQTLTKPGHKVGEFAPDQCDLSIIWSARRLQECGAEKSIVMEVGWLPRSTYQISPTGSNHLAHFSRDYQFEELSREEERFIVEYAKRLRKVYERLVNPERVRQLRRIINRDFVLFPLQLANDLNLRFSDTEFAPLYSATQNNNLALAKACIEKVAAAKLPFTVLFKQHPMDSVKNFAELLKGDALVLETAAGVSSYELFATGRCKAVISVNSNTVHEAAIWNIPVICLGKLIWDGSTRLPPFANGLECFNETVGQAPLEQPKVLSYLNHLVKHQWVLTDFQNPLMVEELLRTQGRCMPFTLRRDCGLPHGTGLLSV